MQYDSSICPILPYIGRYTPHTAKATDTAKTNEISLSNYWARASPTDAIETQPMRICLHLFQCRDNRFKWFNSNWIRLPIGSSQVWENFTCGLSRLAPLTSMTVCHSVCHVSHGTILKWMYINDTKTQLTYSSMSPRK